MKDLFDFLKETDPVTGRETRNIVVMRDGQVITEDDRGYCPGACICMDCARNRVRIKRSNRTRDALARAFK